MEKNSVSPLELQIDLAHLRHNFRYFRSSLKPETKIMAMVKADAYGSGAVSVTADLEKVGADYLGVAYTREGLEIRQAGINLPVMVMNPLPEEFEIITEHRLEPEISNLWLLKEWLSFQKIQKTKGYPIHLKVETGMHRLGFQEEDFEDLLPLLSGHPEMRILSVFSHLASSPLPVHDSFTRQQFEKFDSLYSRISSAIGYDVDRHVLNSAGIYRFPGHQYEMVRLGIGLYGVGLEDLEVQQYLKPVQTLRARIAQIKTVRKGEGVGYSRAEVMSAPRKIAIVQIGYADGLPRLAGNHRFSVWHDGKLYPLTGNVCMDMMMIDITGSTSLAPGSYVEIYGIHHPVIHLAEAAKTIPYEILTANHHRARRNVKR